MFANPVKQVTITCPECNTSIKFDVLPGDGEIGKLISTANNLECPKCKESLAYNAAKIVKAIYDYNEAVSNLIDHEKGTGSKLG